MRRKASGEAMIGQAKIHDMTPRQRKNASLLVQFFVFFIAGVAGLFASADGVSITTVILLVVAAVIGIRLIALLRYIREIDKTKFWVGSTIAAFAISGFFGFVLGIEEVDLGIGSFGMVGVLCTAAHFLLWKVIAFFSYHTNPMPSSSPQQAHETKDLPKEGRVYIAHFDKLFSEIPNFKRPPISKQAQHIREAYMQVHGFISKNPELKPLAHELMDYHFPQALKLLETYGDFTKKKVKVDNIKQILDGIVQSFDTLKGAVDAQLNKLYAGKVLDVKTDMAVLENMTDRS